jgi:DNA-binding NarL/FixJ family response regulator
VRWFRRKQHRDPGFEARVQLHGREIAEMLQDQARLEGVTLDDDTTSLGRVAIRLDAIDREVLALIAEGKSRREIAYALFRDEQQVKGNLERIYAKFPEQDADALREMLRLRRNRENEELRAQKRGAPRAPSD